MGGRGTSSGMRVGTPQYEDLGLGRIRNPLPHISDRVLIEALSKGPSDLMSAGRYEDVNISSLKSTQDYLFKDNLDYMRSQGLSSSTQSGTENEVRIIRYKGNNIIMDGNHRINLERERGRKRIRVKVITIE